MFRTGVCPILEGPQFHCICDSEHPPRQFRSSFFSSLLPPDEAVCLLCVLRHLIFYCCPGSRHKLRLVNANESVQESLLFHFLKLFFLFPYISTYLRFKVVTNARCFSGQRPALGEGDAYFKRQRSVTFAESRRNIF